MSCAESNYSKSRNPPPPTSMYASTPDYRFLTHYEVPLVYEQQVPCPILPFDAVIANTKTTTTSSSGGGGGGCVLI